ncbi:molybdopterin-dependent oxidoreductase [Gloeobacter kilaueensis]|uniref:Oxidoreductase molybdopterin binding protein n=1 Tax=Gloeobacter kilaueensis (strain ATCC BAA-2537 / CCAP 1431/1 / ULC 316 / JS1) TaxID=1183438 RepID=U5QG20_GLOK1|nr:molybdopterin-dependent oxidoreductase [Gloeobacter kilaueensis]AGY57907.1 oxidoreductase molybdopterin binding protein [Gloeobacter kilaueensis JS1]
MSDFIRLGRRQLITAGGMSLLLSACGRGPIQSLAEQKLYELSDPLNRSFEQLLFSPQRLAPEFRRDQIEQEALLINTAEDITPSIDPERYRLKVGGLVNRPASFTLAELKKMPYRSEIVRHVCVEGWAAIVQWGGLPLVELLKGVEPKPEARYVFLRSAEGLRSDSGQLYGFYETWDMPSCVHPQTLLAYEKNFKPLPADNGAPIRLASPVKLGYKQIKWVTDIMLLAALPEQIGYWVDFGYEWYGGL